MLAALLYQYRLQNPAAAIERYGRVLRLVPAHYGAHYQLAVALFAAGKQEEARRAWRTFEAMAKAIGDRKSIDVAPVALRAS
jgi:tetratricopeptide (TPR) repeat protein